MVDAGIRIRSYNVGLGDCFLLSFQDRDLQRDRHILIDFGAAPGESRMMFGPIAEDIHEQTGGHLDVVVVSHDHVDHVGGFLDQKKMFDKFEVDYVWMGLPSKPNYYARGEAATVGRVRELVGKFNARQKRRKTPLAKSFETLMLNNLGPNEELEYARGLVSQKNHVLYLKRGDSVLDKPFGENVQIKVLAPEKCVSEYFADFDADQYDEISDLVSISKQLESKLVDENAKKHPIFSSREYRNAVCADDPKGISSRDWRLLRKKNQSFGVRETRAFDCVINNTSLVLFLTINGKKLLFPGDAEAASWAWLYYAMHFCEHCIYDERKKCPECAALNRELAHIDFLKLAQHGGVNGTPDWLPEKLRKGSTVMVSTKPGVYGTSSSIPDSGLLKSLKNKSGVKVISTNDDPNKLWVDARL